MKKVLLAFLMAAAFQTVTASFVYAGEQEPEKLVVSFRTNGKVPEEKDIERIEECLNEILRKKINCEIKLVITQSSSYKQQMTLMLSGKEQLDVMGVTESMISPTVSGGQLWQLDDLLEEYGQGITEVLGEDLLSCGQYDGKQYFIPILCDTVNGNGTYMLRKDIVEKYEIDTDSVRLMKI